MQNLRSRVCGASVLRIAIPVAVLLGVVVAGAPVWADTVERRDGHRFEGEIVAQDDQSVSIDTVIATIRTTLRIPKSEVESVETKPVPPGFFDPPRPPERASDAKAAGLGEGLYLEIPIVGRFGMDIRAEGVRQALMYASRYRIAHVVFVIDSAGHHDVDEARDVAKALRDYHGRLTYHAVVQDCIGDALAVGLLCDTLHVLPGARIGGAPAKSPDAGDKTAAADEQVVRQQLAFEASQYMQQRGRPGLVIHKMIDPAGPLACWLAEDGKPEFGAEPPADLPAARLVFQSGAGAILVLDAAQLQKIGMPAVEGGASGLGKALGIADWKAESDLGPKTMKATADRMKKEADTKAARFDAVAKKNLSRREAASLVLQRSVQEAAKWNPNQASYEVYARSWGWGWGWRGRYYDRDEGPTTFSQESRRKWKTLTDTSLMYLHRAGQAAAALKRLDEEAVKIGLEPTCRPGELDQTMTDLAAKYAALKAHRDRREL